MAAFNAWACTAAATEATPATVAAALAADMAAEEAAWASWAAWRRVVVVVLVEGRVWVVVEEEEKEEGEMTGEVARSKPREDDKDLRPWIRPEEAEVGAVLPGGKTSLV